MRVVTNHAVLSVGQRKRRWREHVNPCRLSCYRGTLFSVLREETELLPHSGHLWHWKHFGEAVTALVFGTNKANDEVTVINTAFDTVRPVGQGAGAPRALPLS